MTVPILTPDIDIDIEEELGNNEVGHAIASCTEHEHCRPLSGTIVEGLCGRLFRVNWNLNANKCPECAELFDKPKAGICWVCGATA